LPGFQFGVEIEIPAILEGAAGLFLETVEKAVTGL